MLAVDDRRVVSKRSPETLNERPADTRAISRTETICPTGPAPSPLPMAGVRDAYVIFGTENVRREWIKNVRAPRNIAILYDRSILIFPGRNRYAGVRTEFFSTLRYVRAGHVTRSPKRRRPWRNALGHETPCRRRTANENLSASRRFPIANTRTTHVPYEKKIIIQI